MIAPVTGTRTLYEVKSLNMSSIWGTYGFKTSQLLNTITNTLRKTSGDQKHELYRKRNN